MTRSPRFWLTIAVLFLLLNVGGGYFALRMMGDELHVLTHFLLALLGGYWVFWLKRKRRAFPGEQVEADGTDNRLERIEQAVEAIAIEVERVGEGQRFMTRTLTESGVPEPSGNETPSRDPGKVRPG